MHDNEIKSISKDYFDYLIKESKFIPLENESIEFYSPVVDYFGDSISVNISNNVDNYLLTDHGETLWNMEQFGIDLTSHKKQKKYQFLKNIIESNGLVLEDKEIQHYTDRKKLPQAIHDYVLAISEISNLAVLKKENIKSLFKDEVIQYFLKHRDTYPNVFPEFKVEGKSKLTHNFEAVFPGKTTEYVKTIKHINKNSAKNVLFDWDDVEEYRNRMYDSNARLNIITENEEEISDSVATMLSQYNVEVLPFNDKNKLKRKFSNA
ncbi:hypothetical protein B5C01_10560 [Staphylococcus delphini]|uniref:DUF1828 domain-containing protein n=1 Tax=Staphylococcus delphini TaxID=53344 RepID=A0A2A4GUP1_9STAP|nr:MULTISPECIES: DUF1828 domain-containing protein [Staphylococcus]MDM7881570.1 DUF1828 domain-containing protein [Staphylococcus borealis]PCF53183.1 hypothetical protein B5C08_12315 [Staphylococcus delphini]PCF60000.1 hypothetical protein B5C01_10560 [Staphylococcus delphini]HEC2158325.1 DUF1829 domain-containing protein [Staphylococcus delphini]